jgi:hypothetical protein
MPAEPIGVVIADEDRRFTRRARSYFESSGFEVVKVVDDGQSTLGACRRSRPFYC